MILSRERILFLQREVFVGVVVFLITALFFISLSVFATTIGTNIDATGTMGAATSTPWGVLAVEQTAGKSNLLPVFVVGDTGTNTPAIFVSQKGVVSFGSSTPSGLFLNVGDVVIGRHGATNDLYVSGGLGVGNATTTDNGFVVGTNFILYGNGSMMVGGTTTLPAAAGGFAFEKANAIFSSGADATTTVGVIAESTTKGGGIEMTGNAGALHAIFINAAGTGLTVQPGSCQ